MHEQEEDKEDKEKEEEEGEREIRDLLGQDLVRFLFADLLRVVQVELVRFLLVELKVHVHLVILAIEICKFKIKLLRVKVTFRN